MNTTPSLSPLGGTLSFKAGLQRATGSSKTAPPSIVKTRPATRSQMKRRGRLNLVPAALLTVVGCSTQAATVTWSGSTSANISGVGTNWIGGAAPGSGDIAEWNSATYTNSPNANANITIGELWFASGNTGGVTFGTGANTITLNGVLTSGSNIGIQMDNGSGAVNLGSAKFALGAAQNWTNNSANTLTVVGAITNNGYTLTLNGSGTSNLSGGMTGGGGLAVSNGNVTLNPNGAFTGGVSLTGGQLTLNSNGAFTGGIVVTSGTLVLGHNNGMGSNNLTIGGGGATVDATGTRTTQSNNTQTWNGDWTYGGTATWNTGTGAVTLGAASINLTNAGANTLTVGGAVTGASNLTLTANAAGGFTFTNLNNTGTVTNSGTGAGTTTLTAVGSNVTAITESSTNSALTVTTLNVAGGGTTLTNALGTKLLTVTNTVVGTGNLTIANNSALISGITFTAGANNSGTITNSGSGAGTTTIPTVGANVTGLIQSASNSLASLTVTNQITGGGSFTLSDNSSSAAALTLTGGFNNAGTLTNNGSGTGTVTVGAIGASVTNVTQNSASSSMVLNGANTYNNANGYNIQQGTLSISNATTFANAAKFTLSSGGRLEVNVANQSLAKLATANGGSGVVAGSYLRLSAAQTAAGTGPGTIYGTVELNVTNINPNYVLDFGDGSTLTSVTGASGGVYTSAITLSGNATIDNSSSTGFWYTNAASGITASTSGTKTLTLAGNNATASYINGIIGDGSGKIAITKTGASTWMLLQASTFSGGVNLKAGQLNINNASALGTGTFAIGDTSGSTAVTIDNTTANIDTNTSTNAQTWNQNFTFIGSRTLNLGTGAVTLAASRQVTVTNSTLTVGGVIGDGGQAYSLTKSGAGTLVLSGSNTFTGGVNLAAGTLSLGNDAALGTGTLTISANTSITSPATRATTNNNAQVWNGDWAYTGVNANWNTGTGAVTLGADAALTNSGGGGTVLTVGGTVTGAHNLTLKQNGAGGLTIAGVNNTGTVTNAGSGGGTATITNVGSNVTSLIQNSNNNALNITNQLTAINGSSTVNLSKTYLAVNGSQNLSLNGGVNTIGSITNDNTGTGALSIGPIGNLVTSVTENSTTSMLILSASSSYTGPTTVTSGTLRITNASALGSGTVSVANGAVLELYNTGAVTNALTINGNGTGNGALSANGNNTSYYNGTITLGSDSTIGCIGTSSGLNFTINSTVSGTGNLTLKANNAQPMTFASVNNTGTVTNSGTGTGSVILNAYGSNVTSITQNSTTSMLDMRNNAAGVFTGVVNLVAGKLFIYRALALGNSLVISAGTTIDSNGVTTSSTTQQTWNGDWTYAGGGSWNTSTGAVTLGASSINLTNSGSATLTVGGAVSGTSNLTLTTSGSGGITFSNLNNTGAVTNSGTGTGAATLSAVGGNVTGITQSGASSLLALSGSNSSFAGAVSVTTGSLQIGNAYALNANNAVTVGGTGAAPVFDLNNNALTIAGLNDGGYATGTVTNTGTTAKTLTLGGTGAYSYGGVITATTPANLGLMKTGAGAQTLTGANTYTGATTISSGTLTIGGAGVLGGGSYGAAISNTGTLVYASSAVQTLSGNISGPGSLTQNAGILTLTGSNTYTGATTITGGTLQIGNGGAGSLSSSSAITNNAALIINCSNSVAGTISGTGGIAVTGGALTLNGVNPYMGPTAVTGGTLNLASATLSGNGTVSINGGGVLAGAGTIAGPVIVAGGTNASTQGTINLANGTPGTLNLGGLTVGGATVGTTILQFDAGGSGSDLIALGTNAFIVNAGGAVVKITDLGGTSQGQTLSLMTFTNAMAPTGITLDPTTQLGFNTGSLVISATALQLSITGPAAPATAFFTGAYSTAWNGSSSGTNANFTTDSAGTNNTHQLPGAVTDVFLGANGVSTVATTLGANFNVHSLNFVAGANASVSGSNTLTIGGGGITVNASSTGAALSNSSVVLGANQTWTNNSLTVPLNVSATVSGSGSLTVAGGGRVVLSSSNNYTGGTALNGGKIQIGSASALGSGPLAINSGTLDLNGYGISVGALSGSAGGAITSNAGAVTLTAGDAGNTTYAGVISGPLGLVKTGAGSLTLASGNSYSGSTTVNAGTLVIGAPGAIGSGTVTINSGGSLDLYGNTLSNPVAAISGTLYNGSASAATVGVTLSNSNRAFTAGGVGNIVFNTVSGTTGLTLNKIGGDTVTLNGSSDDANLVVNVNGGMVVLNHTSTSSSHAIGGSGTSTISSGTLQLAGTGGAQISGSHNIAINGGVFDLNGQSQSIVVLGGSGGVLTNNAAGTSGTLTMTGTGIYSGAIQDGAGQVAFSVNSPSAIVTLGGSNSFTGATSILSGTLVLANANAVQNSVISPQQSGQQVAFDSSVASHNFNVGGLANFAGCYITLTDNGSNPVTLTVGGNNTSSTFTGNLLGAGSLVKTGSGVLTLGGDLWCSGTTTIAAGTLKLSGTASNGALSLMSGARLDLNTANQSLAQLATANGGSGIVAGSYLRYSQAQTTGGAGPGTVFGTVELNVTNVNPNYTLDFGAGSTLTNLVTSTYTSPITLSGNATIDASLAVATYSTGGVTASTAGAKTLTLTGSNTGANTFSGVIADGANGGTIAVAKNSNGVWTLSGSNTFTGGVNLTAGKLILGHDAALGAGALTITSGTVDVSGARASTNNNTQIWNGDWTFGSSYTWNTGTGAVTLGASSINLTTNGANALTVGGVIGDGGSGYTLTKAGAGTLVLSGSNTFSGGVNLAAGTLSLGNDAALGTGTLTISANTSITSTANGRVTTNNNAQVWNGDWTYTGGNVNGNLGNGAVTLGADVTVTNNGAGSTALTVGGTVTGAHNLTLKLNGAGGITIGGVNNTGTVTNAGTGNLSLGVTITTLGGNVTNVIQNSNTFANALYITNQITQLGGSSTFNISKTNFAVNGSQDLKLNGGVNMNGSITNDNTGTGGLTIGAIGNLVTSVTENSTTSMLILTGASSYTGPTTVTSGTLRITNGSALGSGTTTVANGAVLEVYNATGAANALTINGNGSGNGALVSNGNNNASYNGTITLGSDSTIGSTDIGIGFTFTVNSTVSGTGNLTLKANNAQSITLGANNTGTITNSGTGSGGVTLNTVGSNVTSITQSSTTSKLTLNGNTNSFSGAINLTAGKLYLQQNAALGSGTLVITSGTVDVNSVRTTTYNNLQTWNGDWTYGGAATWNTGTGAVTLGASSINLTNSGIATLTVGGAVSGTSNLTLTASGSGGITFSNLNNTGTVTNSGTGTGTATLSVVGGNVTGVTQNSASSTLALTGSSAYSGGTVVNAGMLKVGNANALGTGGLTVNGGALNLNGVSVGVAGLSGTGGTITNLASGTSTLTAAGSGTSSYAGNIADGTGAVVLTNSGAGTLILSGSLSMTGLHANSGVTELTRSGSIGAVNVATGATLSMAAHSGSNYNVLNVSSLAISGFSSSLADANSAATAGPAYSPAAVSQTNAGVLTDTGIAVAQAAGATGAAEPASPEAVPEPGTLGLLLAGVLGCLGFRRKANHGSR